MLFEMCHPAFSTAMERAIIFNNLAQQKLPSAKERPARRDNAKVCELILHMVARDPTKRPSAEAVVGAVQGLTAPGPVVLSLDYDELRGAVGSEAVLSVEVDLQVYIDAYLKANPDSPRRARNAKSAEDGKSGAATELPFHFDPSTAALNKIRSCLLATMASCSGAAAPNSTSASGDAAYRRRPRRAAISCSTASSRTKARPT